MTGEFSFYVGIDWATEQHQACVMDSEGHVLESSELIRQERFSESF